MMFVDQSDFLAHYGVLGMKWGVRKDGMPQGYQGSGSAASRRKRAAVEGGLIGYTVERNRQRKNGEIPERSNKNTRMAKKDAKRMAKANANYGAGSGNERKALKSQINSRSKNPEYKKAYDKAYANQNHARLAAKSERRLNRDLRNARRSDAANIGLMAAGVLSVPVITMALQTGVNSMPNLSDSEKADINNIVATLAPITIGALSAVPTITSRDARRRLNYSY